MCVYTHIYIYIYTYVCIYIYVCMCMYLCRHMYIQAWDCFMQGFRSPQPHTEDPFIVIWADSVRLACGISFTFIRF